MYTFGWKKSTKGSPIQNTYRSLLEKRNIILKLVLIFLSILFFVGLMYILFAPKYITFTGDKQIQAKDLTIYIEDQKVDQNGDMKLLISNNLMNKSIQISHPDYVTKNLKFDTYFDILFPKNIKLEPVDYAQLSLDILPDTFSFQDKIEEIAFDGMPVENYTLSKEKISFSVERTSISQHSLILKQKNFNPINMSLDLSFGRNYFALKQEYNRSQTFEIIDYRTGKPITNVKNKETDLITNEEGKLTINHLEKMKEITFSRDGYIQKTIPITENDLNSVISLTPLGKITYTRFSDPQQTKPISSLGLFSANYDGTDEKLIDTDIQNVSEELKDTSIMFITGKFESGKFAVKKVNLETNEVTNIDTFVNDEYLGGKNVHKSQTAHLNAGTISLEEQDNGGLYPTYNKLWVKKVGSNQEQLVRDRSFAKGTSETVFGHVVAPNGDIIAYSTEKWSVDQKLDGKLKPSFTLKIVRISDGSILWDKNYGLDAYQQPRYFIDNKYLVHVGGLQNSVTSIINIETKEEFSISYNQYLKRIDEKNILITRKNENKTSFIEFNLESRNEKELYSLEDLKNIRVFGGQVYVRKETQWYSLAGGILLPTAMKINIPFLSSIYGDFTGDPRGWGPGSPPQEYLDRTF
jgi:hypothetical protein